MLQDSPSGLKPHHESLPSALWGLPKGFQQPQQQVVLLGAQCAVEVRVLRRLRSHQGRCILSGARIWCRLCVKALLLMLHLRGWSVSLCMLCRVLLACRHGKAQIGWYALVWSLGHLQEPASLQRLCCS